MSQRSPTPGRRSPRRHSRRELAPLGASIDPAILASVVGGRVTPRTTLDPVLGDGIQKLSQAIASIGQSLAAAKQGSSQQTMQMMQQMMQPRGK
jgi:hypothetical protein